MIVSGKAALFAFISERQPSFSSSRFVANSWSFARKRWRRIAKREPAGFLLAESGRRMAAYWLRTEQEGLRRHRPAGLIRFIEFGVL